MKSLFRGNDLVTPKQQVLDYPSKQLYAGPQKSLDNCMMYLYTYDVRVEFSLANRKGNTVLAFALCAITMYLYIFSNGLLYYWVNSDLYWCLAPSHKA